MDRGFTTGSETPGFDSGVGKRESHLAGRRKC